MPRLTIECRSIDARTAAAGWEARLLLAVARAEDGAPVGGLQQTDFRVRGPSGSRLSLEFETASREASSAGHVGVYAVRIRDTAAAAEPPDALGSYPIGIQVRRRESGTGAWALGQTVVRLPELADTKVLSMRTRALGRATPPGTAAALALPRGDMPLRLCP